MPLITQYQSKHGFPGGQERNHLVGINDIYAPICDLIGIEVPYFSAQDSISFADYTFYEKILMTFVRNLLTGITNLLE